MGCLSELDAVERRVALGLPASSGADPWAPESIPSAPPATACKHGQYACERCGTSDRRDALHATSAGWGRVARLRREGLL